MHADRITMSAAPSLHRPALVAVAAPVGAYALVLAALLVPATNGGLASVAVALAFAVALPIILLIMIPVRAIADRLEEQIQPVLPSGPFHGAATDVAIGLGDPSALLIRHADEIDVTGLPTTRRDIVVVSTGVFDVLTRREVVALTAARLAALRDPWCRIATQAALAWWSLQFTLPFVVLGFVAGASTAAAIASGLLIVVLVSPNWSEEIRNRCVDLAAILRTTDPGGLAGAVRRVSGLGRRSDDLDVDPIPPPGRSRLAPPRLAGGEMTTNVGLSKVRRRHIVRCLRLLAIAEAKIGMVEPVGVAPTSGRDLRRQWAQLGRPLTPD